MAHVGAAASRALSIVSKSWLLGLSPPSPSSLLTTCFLQQRRLNLVPVHSLHKSWGRPYEMPVSVPASVSSHPSHGSSGPPGADLHGWAQSHLPVCLLSSPAAPRSVHTDVREACQWLSGPSLRTGCSLRMEPPAPPYFLPDRSPPPQTLVPCSPFSLGQKPMLWAPTLSWAYPDPARSRYARISSFPCAAPGCELSEGECPASRWEARAGSFPHRAGEH